MVSSRFVVAGALLLTACGDPDKSARSAGPTAPEPEGGGRLLLQLQNNPALAAFYPDSFPEGLAHLGGARFWRGQWPSCRYGPVSYGCSSHDDCPYPGDGDVEAVIAGEVTLGALTLLPPEYEAFGPGIPWSDGETLDIAARGDPDGVPAFRGNSIAPSFVTLVEPAPGSLAVAGPGSMEIVWSGTGYGDVLFSVASVDGVDFQCRWPSADGSGVVPGELLEALEPSSDGNSRTAAVNGFSEAVVTTGSFDVVATIVATRSGAESGFLIEVP